MAEHSVDAALERLTSLARGLFQYQYRPVLPDEIDKFLSGNFTPHVRRILEDGYDAGSKPASAEVQLYKSLWEKSSAEAADWARKYDAAWAQKSDLEHKLKSQSTQNSSTRETSAHAAQLTKLTDKVADLEQQVAILAR